MAVTVAGTCSRLGGTTQKKHAFKQPLKRSWMYLATVSKIHTCSQKDEENENNTKQALQLTTKHKNRPTVFTVCSAFFIFCFFPQLGNRQTPRLVKMSCEMSYETNMKIVMFTGTRTFQNIKHKKWKYTSWYLIVANKKKSYFAYLILWEYELL